MHNRDRYDRLTRALYKLMDVENELCDVEWELGETYDRYLKRITKVRKELDRLCIEIDQTLERFTKENIDFGDGNKTDRADFLEIIEKKRKETAT